MSKHTPTPWECSERYVSNHLGCCVTEITSESSDYWIAQVPDTKDGDEANADFIVRACNAHDKLVEALEDCVARFEEESFDVHGVTLPWMEQARDALALAKESK